MTPLIKARGKTPDVRVNGVLITPEAIAEEAQHHPAPKPEQAWQFAAEALAIRELLVQAARDSGIEAKRQVLEGGRVETEEEAMIRLFLDREVSVPEPDEESCRRYYDNNRKRLRSPDIFEPAHILIPALKTDPVAYDRARADAVALITHLQAHPDHFDRLAREHSKCESAANGGRLGQVVAGETTPEFDQALRGMAPGAMTHAPVETRYGFHIVRLDRKIQGRIPGFDSARPFVEEFLRDASWRRGVAQLISLVVGEASVEGVELHGAVSPLVQ